MILSTQSFQNVELESDVKDQFHLRIGLRHASAMGCRALMGRDNDAMLTLERFTAIYNSHQGEPQHNRAVALDNAPDFLPRLDRLKAKYPQTPPKRTAPPQAAVAPPHQWQVCSRRSQRSVVSCHANRDNTPHTTTPAPQTMPHAA